MAVRAGQGSAIISIDMSEVPIIPHKAMVRTGPLSVEEETKIIALLARGDSKAEIQAALAETGRPLSVGAIAAVKKRNIETFMRLKAIRIDREVSKAIAIRDQANRVLESELDGIERQSAILARAGQQYIDGDITLEQYIAIRKTIKRPSLSELTSVSKEMNMQGSDAPAVNTNPEADAAIRAAIEAGDEVTLTQLIFKKASAP
jgi:hypothetical protein